MRRTLRLNHANGKVRTLQLDDVKNFDGDSDGHKTTITTLALMITTNSATCPPPDFYTSCPYAPMREDKKLML